MATEAEATTRTTAHWVRYVWWPLMVVFTAAAVGYVVRGAALVANGDWGPGLVSLVLGIVLWAVMAREWPNWRTVSGRS